MPFAVVPDLRESENLEALTDEDMDQRLGFPVVHLKAGGTLSFLQMQPVRYLSGLSELHIPIACIATVIYLNL